MTILPLREPLDNPNFLQNDRYDILRKRKSVHST